MQLLVFRHVPFEDAGRIAPILARQGFQIEYADLYRDAEPPADWRSAAGLVLMGGPMSANDDLPFLRLELALIRQALVEGKPVLGVCLGAQLLAHAAGARVYPNAVKEIGWAPVDWTEAAARDPLFRELPPGESLFHWHGETFDLPPGAEHLAWSGKCRNQAFRLGEATYGLQFHLEVTPEMVEDWCGQEVNAQDARQMLQPADSKRLAARLGELAEIVFGRWGELVRMTDSKCCRNLI